MDAMGSAKKKKNKMKSQKTELIQIRLPMTKPGSKKYTHVDYNELLSDNGKQRDEDELKRFYDEDTLFMAKKLAETKSKSGKRIRVNLDEIQHMNRNCGYDMDDDFIDDTEAVDDGIFTSKKGGFYVGKGNLKDFNDDDEDDEEESEEEEDLILEPPKKQKKQEKKQKEKKTSGGSKTTSSSDSESEVERGPQRLTGGPPTIRMAGGPPKRPAPGAGRPSEIQKTTKKVPEVVTLASGTSTSSGDVICLEEEPPAKKKPVLAPSGASSKKDSEGASTSSKKDSGAPKKDSEVAKPLNSTTKGSTVTMLAKKICKQQEMENGSNKPKSSSTTSSSASSTVPSTPQKPDPSILTLHQSPPKSTSSGASGAPTTSSSSPKTSTSTEISNILEEFTKLGKEHQERKSKTFDDVSMKLFGRVFDALQNSKPKANAEPIIIAISQLYGVKKEEILKIVQEKIAKSMVKQTVKQPEAVKENAIIPAPHEALDWQLTPKDLPLMNLSELQMLTTIVKSWTPKKKLPHAMLMAWVKKCNQEKMDADQARVKFYDLVQNLPDVNKNPDQQNGMEMPKHERSRKARMFLHQWVYLSRRNVELIYAGLKKKPVTADGLALKQLNAANALKEALKKQIALFENKKDRLGDDAVYIFQFSEPVLAAIHPYLEDMTDYAISIGKLELVVTAMDTLHQAIDNKITQIQFYLEICRRLQKLSFLSVEEPMKTRLKQANEHISKHQVVQNSKYQIKWPGEEPSMRGLNKELHDFTTPILVKCARSYRNSLGGQKPATPKSGAPTSSSASSTPKAAPSTSTPTTTSIQKPSTSSGTPGASASLSTSSGGAPGASTSSGATSGVAKPSPASVVASAMAAVQNQRLQAMSQLVQMYLGKYLLATGNSTNAEISDPKKCPISDEILPCLVVAVYSSTLPDKSKMAMFMNILTNVGQTRMAPHAIEKSLKSQKLTEEQYQKLLSFFGTLEKASTDQEKKEKAERLAKTQAENIRKMEERLKKDREKQAEKERLEAKKKEEKERKEKEKRDEKEKKEREMRENLERKRREEEDRIRAQRMLALQEEDRKRKKEAEEAVEKELERRAKMEKEAADALQGLEEDLLKDDIDFVAEQQSKVDEERKIAEAKRAEERENQIKMMRAQQAQRRREDTPPPVVQEVKSTVIQNTPSTLSQTAPEIKNEIPEQPPVDILNAAQEMLGLDSFVPVKVSKPEIPSEKPMSAFEKLQSLRGRTMSADMKRGAEMQQNSPFLASQNQQQFFPTTPTQPLQHMDPPPFTISSNSEIPRLQHQNSSGNLQIQNPQMLNSGIQTPLMNQMNLHTPIFQPQPIQQGLQHQNSNSMSSGNLQSDFGASQNMEIREQGKRSMSMSQMTHPHHQSPQNLQQQFPSYQSPIMNNSSLMHTPLSNNSMVSQSSQFSSQPSPMSQQFHTPPSVGMMNNPGMVQSPMAQPNQTQFSNFNYNQQQ